MGAKCERQAGASSWESLHFRGKNMLNSKKAPVIPLSPKALVTLTARKISQS